MRPIDADAMIDRLKEWDTKDKTDKALYSFTLNRINEQPTIQPVQRGHWIPKFDGKFCGGAYWYDCSKCGHTVAGGVLGGNKFCKNCGARNDGE